MSIEEVIFNIEIARAEVEWQYPLDYAVTFDEAIKYLNELKKLKENNND